MRLYGLIGIPLSHSFSAKYFNDKFRKEDIKDCRFENFEIENESKLKDIIAANPGLRGLSVTIPYKQTIMSFLDNIDPVAQKTGAVNCIKVDNDNGKTVLTGYNTDIYGFEKSLRPLLKPVYKKALVLGSGGASKAVTYVLDKLGIDYLIVTRTPSGCKHIRYGILHKELMEEHNIIINATPVGMYPAVDTMPQIPYEYITQDFLLYDLVYNPVETLFLKEGAKRGATVKNGLEMLYLQAEKAWEIWNAG